MDKLAGYTDQQLAVLVKENDADAFVELTARYMGVIRIKAASLHAVPLDADDLCQEGLLGLFGAARSYRPDFGTSFRTYAGICIENRMVSACRVAAGRKNLPLNNFVSLSADQNLESFVTTDQVANPETLLIDRESVENVRRRINQSLSKMEQQVLLLYLGGRSYEEISVELNISVKAVDNAIQRVRRKLKRPF